jgi:hypothetical protein
VLGLAVVAVGGEFAFEKPAAEVAGMLAHAEGTGGVEDLRRRRRSGSCRSS